MRKASLFLGAIFLVFILVACSEEDESDNQEEEDRVVSVETAEIEEGNLSIDRTISGRVEPNKTTPITVEQPGEVETLDVESGANVEEDDKIATVATPAGTQTIYAPSDGELMQVQAEEGEIINPEEPFAIIADTSSWKLQFTATARILELINKDDTFTATINGNEFEATITQIDAMPDDTGLYPVVATIDDEEDQDILTGTVAALAIPETVISDSLLVPTASVVEENNESYVYIVVDNQVERKKVTVNEMQSQKTAVEGELEPGDEIVTSGQLTLQDGDSVEVVKGE
ncbi:efflux transporter periplasmic adaptor subunit [Oceanobacillus sp. E9]|uniref:Efflux RND transporter periplasmic adaptor subunit n=1 Tax=Oceanobacillus kimchii TaxID=746691 RepID=A0ABQ5TLB9_9BACI|nr:MULTISPECIES: efflux RND transporter periplasmic adaptor subunit [Oceanobacillus]MBT2599406.1 efflux RND transporter periplasmic adaptor subunit [Oceanobacillus sp. ISL-74]OEH55963.1 efflux transporter periplasmic adaptor subunit [Oceanobacillus sp. E9]GLO67626.1 hypothetical protein MACH08_34100 [Oceanobacillus kimchii]